jgi:hypothetical protein
LTDFTARAARQYQELREHFEDRGRREAIRTLIVALDHAAREIEADPDAGFPAPRPNPMLAGPGAHG